MEQACAFTVCKCVCTIAHYTFYTICMFMFPVQGHYQTKTNIQKKAMGDVTANSQSACRHILKHLCPSVQKKKS